ncbi:unnamed protein product [Cylindrotheca closterium]|nr:unnamed protein product [Cylindrotheca closterium]
MATRVDQVVKRVSQKGDEWRSLPMDTKIKLLEQIIQNTIQYRNEWVACHQSNLLFAHIDNDDDDDDDDPSSSTNDKITRRTRLMNNHGYAMVDILVRGPATLGSYANGILDSLKHNIQKNNNDGRPPPPVSTRTVGGGPRISRHGVVIEDDVENENGFYPEKIVATVWPSPWSLTQSLEAFGMKAEMVCDVQDSAMLQQTHDSYVQEHNSKLLVSNNKNVGCSAILAAGNFDAPTDLLCELFIKGRVCVYKANPINEASIPILKKILKPLLDLGYVEFSPSTSIEAAQALVEHQGIQEIVFTGSKATLDRIVWGNSKEEQDQNKAKNTPINTTPVCSELGSVNPWIIVPGPQWNKRSVDDHARAMVFAKMSNNGHICVSPQVIIYPKDWKFRQLFREKVEHWMSKHPGTVAFYPGSHETHQSLQQHPNAKLVPYGNPKKKSRGHDEEKQQSEPIFPGEQRPLFIGDMSLENERDQNLLRQEAWCPVLMELAIDAEDVDTKPMEYLRKAVDTANTNLYGSLSINILIDNKTMRRNKKELDHIIVHEMPYGLVGINVWPCYVNSMSQVRWGAFVGTDESGSGTLANAHLYRNVEKTVLRAPFRHLPRKAIQVMDPKKAHLVFSRFTTFKLKPNIITQVGLFAALFLGI